jgi:hypothetical protein
MGPKCFVIFMKVEIKTGKYWLVLKPSIALKSQTWQSWHFWRRSWQSRKNWQFQMLLQQSIHDQLRSRLKSRGLTPCLEPKVSIEIYLLSRATVWNFLDLFCFYLRKEWMDKVWITKMYYVLFCIILNVLFGGLKFPSYIF